MTPPWSFKSLGLLPFVDPQPPEVEFVVVAVVDQDTDDPPLSLDEAVAIVAAKYDLDKDAVVAWLKKARLVRKVTQCLKQGRELRGSSWVRWLRRMSLL